MIFNPSKIAGVYLITPDRKADERGYFARTFCEEAFEKQGIPFAVKQASTSFNHQANTLRGMHYQQVPKAESKLVRCVAGAVYDVALDLRPASPTYCQWFGAELSAQNGHALFIPQGCAHGFITLQNDSEVFYMMDEFYDPALSASVRWDDPSFGILWPHLPEIISPKDSQIPDFKPRFSIRT